MIKVIFMDLGGVYFTEGKKIAIERIEKKLSINMKKLNQSISYKEHAALWRRGKINQKEFIKKISKEFDIIKETATGIVRIWHDSYRPKNDMKILIRKLRKNYKVVVLSGNTRERVRYIDNKHDFQKEFDKCLYSFTFGINKPDARIFKSAIKKLKIKPNESVMIDDSDKFLRNVKRSGGLVIRFRNPKKLQSDLRDIGVIV